MLKREQGVTEQDLDQLSSLFRLLSDKTRLSILLHLAEGERNVTNLCEELGLPQPTVSHHLKVLYDAGLLGRDKRGTWVYYRIVPERMSELRDVLALPSPAAPAQPKSARSMPASSRAAAR